jgi:hypothetical protein
MLEASWAAQEPAGQAARAQEASIAQAVGRSSAGDRTAALDRGSFDPAGGGCKWHARQVF